MIKSIPIVLFWIVALNSFHGFAQRQVSIGNEYLIVNVSTLGAELQNIKNTKTNKEYLWNGNSEYWEDRSPVMFPVNVRFKDDRFTHKGIEYFMPKMGLAKISKFEVIQNESDLVILELKSNSSTLKKYPFHFRFEVSYRLKKRKLISQFIVENTGKDTMYFALGGHPGFRFSETIKVRGDYQYTFSKKLTSSRFDIENSLIQSTEIPFLENEKTIKLNDSRIPRGGMLFLDTPVKSVGFGLVSEKSIIDVDLGNFPNVNLWSPPGYPFVCIEPMVAHHDFENTAMAIENKDFLISLPPGKSKTYYFSIIINNL